MRNRKGHYKELFEQIRKKGYLYVRVDGEVREMCIRDSSGFIGKGAPLPV